MQVIPSRDVRVAGLLGPASSLKKKGRSVARKAVGQCGTTVWKIPSLYKDTTLAIVFEIVAHIEPESAPFMQILTRYWHASGEQRCHVTTVLRRCFPWTAPPGQRLHIQKLRVCAGIHYGPKG